MFAFEIFEKNAFFCLFANDIWQFPVSFKKSTSRLPESQLTTNAKRITHSCFARKIFGRKMHFSKFEKIRFYSFYAKTFAKNVLRVYHSKEGENF